MKHSLKVGFSFGLTSGVITTLGLMVGLNSSTQSRLAVLGGILVIAIADALSDAMGIHMSEEAENRHTYKEVWESTLSTFFNKFIFALSFVVPVLLFTLSTAIIVSVVWGLVLISVLSFYIAKKQKKKTWKIIAEHVFLTIAVVLVAHTVGVLVRSVFG